jgi:hypothetical protein
MPIIKKRSKEAARRAHAQHVWRIEPKSDSKDEFGWERVQAPLRVCVPGCRVTPLLGLIVALVTHTRALVWSTLQTATHPKGAVCRSGERGAAFSVTLCGCRRQHQPKAKEEKTVSLETTQEKTREREKDKQTDKQTEEVN